MRFKQVKHQPVLFGLVVVLSMVLMVACGTAADPAPADVPADVNSAPAESNANSQPESGESPAAVDGGATGNQDGPSSGVQSPPSDGQTGVTSVEPAANSDNRSDSSTDTPVPAEAAQPAQSAPATDLPPVDDYTGPVGGTLGDRGAEIEGIHHWLNSDPLTLASLRGKVVLIDFWTYTCINCIRTFPFLRLWNSRYADDGLVIIGVHSPEFEFEKELANVTRAAQEDGIIWPVALDNDFVTWRNYSNRFWPAKYLIDQNGEVRYTHFGEGKYAETEEQIRELLLETGAEFVGGDMALPSDQTIDPSYLGTRGAEVTRELYGGTNRGFNDYLYGRGGYVGQAEYYTGANQVLDFQIPGELTPHMVYFDGPWRIGPESIQHGRETDGLQDTLSLVYSAVTVNAVLTSESGNGYRVTVTAGGDYLTEENKGDDIIIGSDGKSCLMVTEPRLYRILANPEYKRRERLVMASDSADFGLFAFTFGIYHRDS